MIIFLLQKLFPSYFPKDMNYYSVLFTCARGRAGNFRTVRAESAEAAQAWVEANTPTLGEVYEVLGYIGPAAN